MIQYITGSPPQFIYNYSPNKTFVIQHPVKSEKYLVHACLEGPEAGVYYRGTATIDDSESKAVDLYLADYVTALATDFTVYATPILNLCQDVRNTAEPVFPKLMVGKSTAGKSTASKSTAGKFTVYSNISPCTFNYVVFGKRQTIEVEPLKAMTFVKGEKDSPYKWI